MHKVPCLSIKMLIFGEKKLKSHFLWPQGSMLPFPSTSFWLPLFLSPLLKFYNHYGKGYECGRKRVPSIRLLGI